MAKTDFKVIDISMKITNQLPMIRITEDLVVTVNNRKNNILCVQAMASEAEKKVNEDGDNGIGFMVKALEMLVGKEAADKIEDMDLPLPEYKEMYNYERCHRNIRRGTDTLKVRRTMTYGMTGN